MPHNGRRCLFRIRPGHSGWPSPQDESGVVAVQTGKRRRQRLHQPRAALARPSAWGRWSGRLQPAFPALHSRRPASRCRARPSVPPGPRAFPTRVIDSRSPVDGNSDRANGRARDGRFLAISAVISCWNSINISRRRGFAAGCRRVSPAGGSSLSACPPPPRPPPPPQRELASRCWRARCWLRRRRATREVPVVSVSVPTIWLRRWWPSTRSAAQETISAPMTSRTRNHPGGWRPGLRRRSVTPQRTAILSLSTSICPWVSAGLQYRAAALHALRSNLGLLLRLVRVPVRFRPWWSGSVRRRWAGFVLCACLCRPNP